MTEPRRYAILIGNSEFPAATTLAALRCPPADVRGMREVLLDSEFKWFTEADELAEQPSPAVRKQIHRVFKAAQPQDQILLYYSGHGKLDQAGRLYLATLDTEEEYLETTSVEIALLRRLITNNRCKRVALILDCCHSGAAVSDLQAKGNAAAVVAEQLNQFQQASGIHVLSASTATQAAYEKEGEQYSLFTKHLLDGIRQNRADHDGDGWVSISDLYEYVRQQVGQDAAQTPRYKGVEVEGGQYIVARAQKIYRAERLRAFREKLKSLDDYLLPKIFLHAWQVITDNQPQRDKAYFDLLDALCDEKLVIRDFSVQWERLMPSVMLPSPTPTQVPAGRPPQPAPAAVKPEHEPLVIVHHNPFERILEDDDDELALEVGPAAQSIAPTPQRVLAASPTPVKPPPLKQPASFTETLNGVPLEMIYVPGGKFLMGSPEGRGQEHERPQHAVTVPGFFMGKYQVTQAQWQAVMGGNPSGFKGERLPVERVSWKDASEFCTMLEVLTGRAYRLPSETEWEYACRAGTTGDFAGEPLQMGWYAENSTGKTHPVGGKQANAFGLYDMHGNVWEWCEDDWHDNYNGAPDDGSAWVSGGNAELRILRGGAWHNVRVYARAVARISSHPGDRDDYSGFRVAMACPPF